MTGRGSERWQAEVDARLARLELRAGEAEVADSGFASAQRAGGAPEAEYPDLNAWVRDYFCATFSRPLGGEFRWCAQWPEHREAVQRLNALWNSWKVLKQDPALGMVTWLNNYLDPQMHALLSNRGAFALCATGRHETPGALGHF